MLLVLFLGPNGNILTVLVMVSKVMHSFRVLIAEMVMHVQIDVIEAGFLCSPFESTLCCVMWRRAASVYVCK